MRINRRTSRLAKTITYWSQRLGNMFFSSAVVLNSSVMSQCLANLVLLLPRGWECSHGTEKITVPMKHHHLPARSWCDALTRYSNCSFEKHLGTGTSTFTVHCWGPLFKELSTTEIECKKILYEDAVSGIGVDKSTSLCLQHERAVHECTEIRYSRRERSFCEGVRENSHVQLFKLTV